MDEKDAGDKAGHTEGRVRRNPLRQILLGYEQFEQLVAIVLSVLIALIVLVAMIELLRIVVYMIETETLNPLQQETFHLVFGMIMTLLIALEFKNSIIQGLRHQIIIQVKTVVLIALLALARKFVILDPATGPATIAALAMSLLALGVVYWLMRERDDREAWHRRERRESEDKEPQPPGQAQGSRGMDG